MTAGLEPAVTGKRDGGKSGTGDAWWELAAASTSGRLEDAPKRMESEGRWGPVDESMRLGTHFFMGPSEN